MDKKTVDEVLWSLNHIMGYVKTYGKNDIFDPSHCIMHLENAMKILKEEENKKNEKEKN
jgi:hypothetical protein